MTDRTKDAILFVLCGIGGFVLCWVGFYLCLERY